MATYTGPVSFTTNGTDVEFVVTFPFLTSAFLVVKLDAVALVPITDYTVQGSTIKLLAVPTSGQTVEISRGSGPADEVYLSSFASDMDISARVLERLGVQPWHALQELKVTVDALAGDTDLAGALFFSAALGGYDALTRPLSQVQDPALAQDAATKSYVDAIAEYGVGGVPQVITGVTDGITATYELTGVPDVVANNIMVFLGGAIQQPGTNYFVVAGGVDSSMTFTSLPDAALAFTVFVNKTVKFVPATSIDPGSILTSMLADLGVTTAKIAAQAVTGPKIGTGAVGTANIADNAVTVAKIPDGEITAIKLAAGALAQSVGYDELKTTNFVTPPGGSIFKAILIEPVSGDQLLRAITSGDISDLQTVLAAETLDQFSAPVATMSMGDQLVEDVLDPVSAQDAATKAYVDTAVSGASTARGPFLIAETILGASNVAVDAEWSDTSFERYTVVVENMKSNGLGNLEFRFRNQATVTYGEGSSDYNWRYAESDAPGVTIDGGADNGLRAGDLNSSSRSSVHMEISNCRGGAKPLIRGDFHTDSYSSPGSNFRGTYNDTGDISGVRVLANSTSWVAGVIVRVYGWSPL